MKVVANKKKMIKYMKKHKHSITFFAAFLIILFFYILVKESEFDSRKIVQVHEGDFAVDLVESGEIRAVNAVFIKAPFHWGDELQIIDMAPEGTLVKKGDFLVQFDISALEEDYELRLDQLAQAKTELRRIETETAVQLSTQESDLKKAEYTLEASKLKLELMQYESGSRQENARLQLMKDEIAFEECKMRMESQKIKAAMEMQKAQFGVEQAEGWVKHMEETIDSFRISAPIGGMVVYEEIGGWNAPQHKVVIGDKPRPGQAVMSIPDLSKMEMVIQINEIDIDRISIGQRAEITLDAYPEYIFKGTVSFRARLVEDKVDAEWWRNQDKKTVIKLPAFQTLIRIDSVDQILKPGMTAQARIILDTAKNVRYIETHAVFENEEGKTVVFPEKRYPEPVEVTLGKRNNRNVILESPMLINDRVSITPPDGKYYVLGYKSEMEQRRNEAVEMAQFLKQLNVNNEPVNNKEKSTGETEIQ